MHHDARRLPTELQTADYQLGSAKVPQVSASASRDPAGRIHVSLCNLDPQRTTEVSCDLEGAKAAKVSGRILTAPAMNAHNTFEEPETLRPAEFAGARIVAGGFAATLPRCRPNRFGLLPSAGEDYAVRDRRMLRTS